MLVASAVEEGKWLFLSSVLICHLCHMTCSLRSPLCS